MLGLGERWEDVIKTMEDLKEVGVSILVIGQYLSPSPKHYPVAKIYSKEEFDRLKDVALSLGFERVLCEPLARSSYHAHELVYNV